jgi:hypothetical protein
MLDVTVTLGRQWWFASGAWFALHCHIKFSLIA